MLSSFSVLSGCRVLTTSHCWRCSPLSALSSSRPPSISFRTFRWFQARCVPFFFFVAFVGSGVFFLSCFYFLLFLSACQSGALLKCTQAELNRSVVEGGTSVNAVQKSLVDLLEEADGRDAKVRSLMPQRRWSFFHVCDFRNFSFGWE